MLWHRPTHRTASALLVRDGLVLLERRSPTARVYPNVCDTPGGHVDPGETPMRALMRELWEELDVVPLSPQLVAVVDDLDAPSARRYRHWIWLVERWTGDVRAVEQQELCWVPCDRLLALPDLNPPIAWTWRALCARGFRR